MLKDTRVLAVQIDSSLFDELDEYVKGEKISKQQYISSLIKNDLEQKHQQKQEAEVKQTEDAPAKSWERDDVMKAIDDFIIKNGRVPSQKEYKNENGLPSYGAAGRSLDISLAQYGQKRLNELSEEGKIEQSGEPLFGEPVMNM